MKIKFLLLLSLLLFSVSSFSQVKAPWYDGRQIDVNGLKLGYIYNLDQIKKVLGAPTKINTWEGDLGKAHELRFDKDIVCFDEIEMGLNVIVLYTSRFALNINNVTFKVGDSIEKLRKLPSYTREREVKDEIMIYLGADETSPITVTITSSGIITSLTCAIERG